MKKFGLFLLVLIGIGGYIWWRARTPPTVGEDFARLAPAQQQERRADAQKLQTQVKDLADAARRHERKPFTLEISEEQLNTLLQDNIRSQNAPIKDLRAGISKDDLAVQGQVNYQGIDAVVTMNGNVAVDAGKMRYSISSLQIGGFPAPSSLRKKAEKQVTEQVNKYLARAPGTIEGVETQDGKLVIRGTTD